MSFLGLHDVELAAVLRVDGLSLDLVLRKCALFSSVDCKALGYGHVNFAKRVQDLHTIPE